MLSPSNLLSLALLYICLLFVGVVVIIRETLNRLPLQWSVESWRVLPYAIGGTASFWVIERVSGIV